MKTKEQIVQALSEYKKRFEPEGFSIVGVFGSVARDEADSFSDIDIAYRIDHKEFAKHYPDGFSKLLRIEAIQKSLEALLHNRIDLISLQSSNKALTQQMLKEIVYV